MREFLRILFNQDELVCASATTYGTAVGKQSKVSIQDNFISVNPLKESRADAHCTAFRNYLIEIDKLPLSEQKKYIDSLHMPYSTMVYSGNKSFHFVIALENGFASREDYSMHAKWLHDIVPKADHSTRNPSRFTRLPEVVNHKTGRLQDAIKLHDKIPDQKFISWLENYPQLKPRRKERLVSRYYPLGSHGVLSTYTQEFLRSGAPPGERNNRLFNAACDLALNGYTIEEAFALLSPPLMHYPDINISDCISTIKSAYRRF